MVLLDDVVQIRRGSAATTAAQFAGVLQFGNCSRIRRMAIDVDHPRRPSAAAECQPQEKLRRDQVPFGRQHELDRLAGRIDATVQVGPIVGDLDVGLIDPPGSIGMAQPRSVSADSKSAHIAGPSARS